MNKISARQLYFFLACIAPVGKLVLMPTQLVLFSKNDLLFPALANFALQAGIIFLIMLLSRSNKTVFELLRYTFGKLGAAILSLVLALFFLYAAFCPMLEQKLFVQGVFYDTLPSLVAFAPFFIFSAYLCAKPIFALGRIWDFLAPVAIIGFAGLMIFSIGQADYGALLPVGAGGGKGFFEGFAYTLSWFYDSAIVLLLMGGFRYEKGMAWKSLLSYLAGGAAVLLFLAAYYGIFSDIALRQTFAFAKISKYFAGVTVLGRFDYIFICMLSLVMAFYITIPLQACVVCLRETTGQKGMPLWYAVGVNLILFAASYFSNFYNQTAIETVSVKLFWIFPLFCCLVPLLCMLLRRSPREKIVR